MEERDETQAESDVDNEERVDDLEPSEGDAEDVPGGSVQGTGYGVGKVTLQDFH